MTLLLAEPVVAQTFVATLKPDADTFARSFAPASNYGGGGALSISGSNAVNGSAVQNGLFDALLRFPMNGLVASINAGLGQTNWVIARARLVVTETGIPDNDIFNRGVGGFEIRWLSFDNWVEGSGRPTMPSANGLAWQDLVGITGTNVETSLGTFTNSGTDGQKSFPLTLEPHFAAKAMAGGELTLRLTAADPNVGFTFNSRNFGNTGVQPFLQITAAIDPRAAIQNIVLSNGAVVVRFSTLSNWNYQLQCSDALGVGGPAIWSNLLFIPAQPMAGNAIYQDQLPTQQRFYRLSLTP